MAYGIRISKDGVDVKKELTSANKKDFVFLSDEGSPKVYYAGFLEGEDMFSGATYTHNLGKVPMFFLFVVDSVTSPTAYTPMSRGTKATTTDISTWVQYSYLIILNEGL